MISRSADACPPGCLTSESVMDAHPCNPGSVTRAHTDALSSRGRGLGLIEELSDSWGTDPTVRGSTVWFEMLIP